MSKLFWISLVIDVMGIFYCSSIVISRIIARSIRAHITAWLYLLLVFVFSAAAGYLLKYYFKYPVAGALVSAVPVVLLICLALALASIFSIGGRWN